MATKERNAEVRYEGPEKKDMEYGEVRDWSSLVFAAQVVPGYNPDRLMEVMERARRTGDYQHIVD